jgi:hypothetical protein
MFFVVFVFLFRMKSTTGLLKWKLPSLILKGTLILIFIIGLLLHIASFIPFQNSPKDHDLVPFLNVMISIAVLLNNLLRSSFLQYSSWRFTNTTPQKIECLLVFCWNIPKFTRLYRGGAPFSNTAYSEAMQLVKEYQLGNRSNSKLKKINTISHFDLWYVNLAIPSCLYTPG